MLRLPAWRPELRRSVHPDFLEICEAYELAWSAIVPGSRNPAAFTDEEFRELANLLETEAICLAVVGPIGVLTSEERHGPTGDVHS